MIPASPKSDISTWISRLEEFSSWKVVSLVHKADHLGFQVPPPSYFPLRTKRKVEIGTEESEQSNDTIDDDQGCWALTTTFLYLTLIIFYFTFLSSHCSFLFCNRMSLTKLFHVLVISVLWCGFCFLSFKRSFNASQQCICGLDGCKCLKLTTTMLKLSILINKVPTLFHVDVLSKSEGINLLKLIVIVSSWQ